MYLPVCLSQSLTVNCNADVWERDQHDPIFSIFASFTVTRCAPQSETVHACVRDQREFQIFILVRDTSSARRQAHGWSNYLFILKNLAHRRPANGKNDTVSTHNGSTCNFFDRNRRRVELRSNPHYLRGCFSWDEFQMLAAATVTT
jgi:hypothetical protein